MTWSIFRKDLILLWPLVVLVTLIQVALEWASYKYGFFGASPLARELLRLLVPAWLIGVVAITVAVVHEDTIPGVDQDWLIRPLARSELLLAKMLFVLVTVCVPMVIINLVDELALGFPLFPSLGDAIYKELYLFICLLIPAMAVASATRNAIELVVLIAGLLLLYALTLWVSASIIGENRCPTCDTSVSWLQHLLQHIGLLIGSVVVLVMQFYKRLTRESRWVLALGVVLLVIVQLPWNWAFAVQTALSAPLGSNPTSIKLAAAPATLELPQNAHSKANGARKATQALMQGDVDAAVDNLRTIGQHAPPPAALTVPLQVEGMSHDDILVVDHAVFTLQDAQGNALYQDAGTERHSIALPATTADAPASQHFEVPSAVYQRIKAKVAKVSIDYSLTVRAVVSVHKMRAADGELRSPEVGVCQSGADADASTVRCRQIGRAPNCYASTLYGPDGRHNPTVLSCGSDYRPYLPSAQNIISFSGMEMPLRDAYGVARYDVVYSDIADSYILFKVYEAGAHFRRTVVANVNAG